MKNTTRIALACLGLLFITLGCIGLSGCANTTPPNRVERVLFDTLTNYVQVFRTNEVAVLVLHTNVTELTITNEQHQTITTLSNWVVKTFETNKVTAPAVEEQYTQVPKPAVQSTVGALSSVLNFFLPGSGPMIGTGLMAALAGWGHWRSRQKGTTAVTLVQELAVVRSFLQSLPNGAAYDEAVVDFLRQHQNEVGVATQVVGILASKINNRDVTDGANGLVDYVNSLKSVSVTLPPVAPA